ncbi:hypothetical protein pb186bvf_010998 [Paramecium bursaria]
MKKIFNILYRLLNKKIAFWCFVIAIIFLTKQMFQLQRTDQQDIFGTFEQSIDKGAFRRLIYYNREPITSDDQRYQDVLGQRIIKVERYCESLFKQFPSGIFTPLAWFIGGSSVRHEFVVVHTEKSLITLELGQQKGDGYFKLNIWPYQSVKQLNMIMASQIMKDRYWTRKLNEANQDDIGLMQFCQINKFLGILVLCWRGFDFFKKSQYDVLFKNCKSFAKGIYCFSLKDSSAQQVMQNLLGFYTDYFMEVLTRKEIQSLLDLVYSQTVSNVKKVNDMVEMIKDVRNYNQKIKDEYFENQ